MRTVFWATIQCMNLDLNIFYPEKKKKMNGLLYLPSLPGVVKQGRTGGLTWRIFDFCLLYTMHRCVRPSVRMYGRMSVNFSSIAFNSEIQLSPENLKKYTMFVLFFGTSLLIYLHIFYFGKWIFEEKNYFIQLALSVYLCFIFDIRIYLCLWKSPIWICVVIYIPCLFWLE